MSEKSAKWENKPVSGVSRNKIASINQARLRPVFSAHNIM